MESDGNVSQHLPKPKGPYVPGCMDIMLEYLPSGIFTRLYYPTKANPEQSHHSKYIPWFVDDSYLVGLASAFLAPALFLRVARWWYATDNLHIPALYGEKINADNKLKCIIFSHGYGGSRFMYSIICNELASQGYLVVALEHRDGSAPYTYYYKSKEDAAENVRTPVPINRIYFGRAEYNTVNKQVRYRANECTKALDFLINLNNGVIPHNVLDDVKSDKEVNFKFEDFNGQLDLDNVTIVGHSFGAATALFTLSQRKELKQGILMDPWMFTLKEEPLTESVTQPLLFINTPVFHDSSSLELMEKFLTNEQRQMYTVLNTTHVTQTDSVCVLGYWSHWFMKKLNPYEALKINNALILRFLKQHTGLAEDIKEFELCLSENGTNIVSGLTKPRA